VELEKQPSQAALGSFQSGSSTILWSTFLVLTLKQNYFPSRSITALQKQYSVSSSVVGTTKY
jgi:hypothetical protein